MTTLSDLIINATPARLRPPVRTALLYPRLASNRWRVLPHFVIIGGQRCGTTSLYRYLMEHPSCIPPFQKEVHFFDNNFARGMGWYRANFPTRHHQRRVEDLLASPAITGEASPYYLFHPLVPARLRQAVPDAKLIALLRDPVDRAYSHYQHERKLGHESLSFEEALDAEADRLAGERERILHDPGYGAFNYGHFSYAARGIYAGQLREWFKSFPREQILVVASEDFYADPASVLGEVQRFLGLPTRELAGYKVFNAGRYEEIDPRLRGSLEDLFAPHNRDLYGLLGRDFGWG